MGKIIQVAVSLRALFSVNNSSTPRWGGADSHPVANATIKIEGTELIAITNKFGHAQLNIASLSSGDHVLALTPDAANALRASSDPLSSSNSPVTPSDGNTTDKEGVCRYRPLKVQVNFKIQPDAVTMTALGTCDGATHGTAFVQSSKGLLIDWKPDWIACKNKGKRPQNKPPTFVLLHRTEGPTPGSALDKFIPTGIASHYLIDTDGHVIKLVHEECVANHAGTSWWCETPSFDKVSVGIEIVNQMGPFTEGQYESIIRIIKALREKYPGITRHAILGHGDVRVANDTNLKLADRAGCPGVEFDWTRLQKQDLGSWADPALFKEERIGEAYGGYFKDKPAGKLASFAKDADLKDKGKKPYGVIAGLQDDLASLGYSINETNGMTRTGIYDAATQAAVDRFRRRFMPKAVKNNADLDPTFDRATAIALKRVLLDRQQ